uniref:NADH-ubiquinone oxidoreductase chain 2 n=1 Tax=Acanthosaura lepidogaster TaxID=118088 RepID=Q9G5Z9_9SAUR|nr:NADH dehydrogenase subunit 2 [Acanthosaura lepidogaster]
MQTIATSSIIAGIFLSTSLTALSNNWILAWLSLELNTLAILPVISKTKHPRAIEASTKYFLTQAVASCLLLSSSTINSWQTGTWDITQMANKYASAMMFIALTMKAGTVPTHFWLPEVMQGSTLTTATLIATWQKIAPTILMLSTSNLTPTNMALTLGLLSMTFGGWGGMNQTQLRKMMAYSSITNMGWTVVVLTSEPKMSAINVLTYIIIMLPTMSILTLTSTKTLQNMSSSWTTSPIASTTMALLLLSTAGLPPLTGFFPKLLILNELVMQKLTPIATLATMTSLLNLVFYLRTTYLTTLLSPPGSATSTSKWRQKMSKPKTTALTPTALMTPPALPTLIQ